MNNLCVCCGKYVPEGSQVCFHCQSQEGGVVSSMKVKAHAEICKSLNETYKRKNHDYGDSFTHTRSIIPNAILVRLNDKISRLNTLLLNDKQKVKDESIDDTLIDLANYCIMELVERKMDNE